MLAQTSELGTDLVVQTPYVDGGKTTFFIRGEADAPSHGIVGVSRSELGIKRGHIVPLGIRERTAMGRRWWRDPRRTYAGWAGR